MRRNEKRMGRIGGEARRGEVTGRERLVLVVNFLSFSES